MADNPVVLAYYRDAGQPQEHDAIAWCAAFVGAMLARAGYPLPPPNVALLARSYLTYGIPSEPRPGAIGIWPRGASWQGHVGFVVSVDSVAGTCQLLAGNQGNAVSAQTYRLDEALAFRWPVKPTVAALREAGSAEVRTADKLEAAGVTGAAAAAMAVAVAELTREAPPAPPPPVIEPDAMSLLDQLAAAAKAAGRLFVEYPWLGPAILAALVLLYAGRRMKQRRVARAAAGAPLSTEVLAG